MIEFVTGDFFDYKADIRINTVNCVGVMGAGVALEFKNRYPDMFKEYVNVCKNNDIYPGQPHIWEEYDLFSTCTIINLPTKIHWRNPSEYEYIEKNLIWLRNFLIEKDEELVVTLPALGCGHGGLNWSIVKSMICNYLNDIKAKVLVFEPSSSNKKLRNFNDNLDFEGNNIKIIYLSDKIYPQRLKESFNKELYCVGNINILEYNQISLLFGNTISEREASATFQILDELPKDKYVYVVALNNNKHRGFALEALQRGYKLLLIIPYGIMKLKDKMYFEEYYDNLLFISYTAPNQEFKRYEYINSLKFRLKIADLILYCGDDKDVIKNYVKYLKGYNNILYINYWKDSVEEFEHLYARKIGINAETKRPNIAKINQYMSLLKK